eukprot:Nitzschia sp. Nitz4//scaffold3_size479765//178217//179941//NITZ4_000073-RA/size479765-processed-gene-0.272-mRNA-1//1//CDS//3329550677//2781//frame0
MADWFNNSTSKRPTSGDELPFRSRRSPVICRNGCVASSQPLASSIGLSMLMQGANAAEAAIAVAAALCVTEPCSTGLGGDMFCLYYDASKKSVSCVNGSGKSPAQLNLGVLQRDCGNGDGSIDASKFMFSPHAVTVPGAARGYEDVLQRYGSGNFTLAQLLEPAAKLAEEGFPVAPVTSHHWRNGVKQIKQWLPPDQAAPLTTDGTNGPQPGEVFRNPELAAVLRELGSKGASDGFYQGATGQAIVNEIQKHGGTMTMEDLAQHQSTFPEPISAQYRNARLWQIPPNGQGIAALIALKGLQHLEETGVCTVTAENIRSASTYHALIEMMRLGFADARRYVADLEHTSQKTLDWLLDDERVGTRASQMFDPTKAAIQGTPLPSSCTVSFQVVDSLGNAISFVNSNYMGFGTGIVPEGCGFTLQNRGYGFSLDPSHPNALAGGKRPYHTIIPAMLTYADTGELHSTLSNMGGNMQPQGHIQLTVDLIAGGMDPQQTVDCPRFCIADGTQQGAVQLENGMEEETVNELKRLGHDMIPNVEGHDRAIFGRAQIIYKDRTSGVLWAGSDGRADGCAMGY